MDESVPVAQHAREASRSTRFGYVHEMHSASPYRVPGERPVMVEPVAVVEVVAPPLRTKPRPVETDAELAAVASEAEPRDEDDGEMPYFIRVALLGGFALIVLGAFAMFLFS